MIKHVIVVGGGVSGLAVATYLARAGRTVTLFEKRRHLGGRALTHLRLGFRFNLGPHSVYRAGAAADVYRELGVPLRGGSPPARGIALYKGAEYQLPIALPPLAFTTLLGPRAKVAAARFLWSVRRSNPSSVSSLSVEEWLNRSIDDATLRETVEALVRLTTSCNAPSELSAATALQQLKLAMKGGVIYVDEGWQKLVDALHSHAVAAGVNFVTSSRVVAVEHDGVSVRGLELGGLELEDHGTDTLNVALPDTIGEERGTRIPADVVVLAVDPGTARDLLNRDGDSGIGQDWDTQHPVQMACLDVALSSLPQPSRTFALGIDQPFYCAVHSAYSQLTPRGGALIHVAKYAARASQAEMETILDQIQPDWRRVVVHTRFLPGMTVTHSMNRVGVQRPAPVTAVRGLYLAGDWVGDEGTLSDAALASARSAARSILAH